MRVLAVFTYQSKIYMAEALRFELRRDLHPLSVFKTDPFNRLGMLPYGGPYRTRTYNQPVMSREL